MIRTITPIFSILIAIAIFFFHTKPQLLEMKAFQKYEAERIEAKAKASESNELLKKLVDEKRSKSAKDVARLEVLIPESMSVVNLLTDLHEIARSHNMLFGNISVEGEDKLTEDNAPDATEVSNNVAYADFKKRDITFGLIGTYEQFKSLLVEVEKSLVLMEVTNINVTTGDGPLQQFTVTVRTYALPAIK